MPSSALNRTGRVLLIGTLGVGSLVGCGKDEIVAPPVQMPIAETVGHDGHRAAECRQSLAVPGVLSPLPPNACRSNRGSPPRHGVAESDLGRHCRS